MSDPLEDLEAANAAVADPPATDAPAAPAGVDPDVVARLEARQREQDETIRQLQAQAQARMATPDIPAPTASVNDKYWNDPDAAVTEKINSVVGPQADQIAAQMGNMAVQSFRSQRISDRYFAATCAIFDKKVASLNKVYIGRQLPDQQNAMLGEVWRAALGEMLQEAEKKAPPKTPPANIGGGGTGGGGRTIAKKSLAELDAVAYGIAVKNGWSQEKMDKMAEEIQDDLRREAE